MVLLGLFCCPFFSLVVMQLADPLLLHKRYMGDNVPGKAREQLNYTGGLPLYIKECERTLEGWKGFTVVSA